MCCTPYAVHPTFRLFPAFVYHWAAVVLRHRLQLQCCRRYWPVLAWEQHVALLHTVSLATHQVVGCSADSSDSLDSALRAQQQKPHLVVLCTTPPSPTAAGTPEAVAAELQQLQQAHDKVAQLGKRQLTVYAAVPEASAGVPLQRQLRSVQADVGTCGQLCQVRCSLLPRLHQSTVQGLQACLVLLRLRSGAAKCMLACLRSF